MSTDVYIDELNNNGEYVKCHGRLGYLSNFINQQYSLLAALENINLTFPKLNMSAMDEIIIQLKRFHSWVKTLSGEDKEIALMSGLNKDYIHFEKVKDILAKIPYNSRWRIRVD